MRDLHGVSQSVSQSCRVVLTSEKCPTPILVVLFFIGLSNRYEYTFSLAAYAAAISRRGASIVRSPDIDE